MSSCLFVASADGGGRSPFHNVDCSHRLDICVPKKEKGYIKSGDFVPAMPETVDILRETVRNAVERAHQTIVLTSDVQNLYFVHI
jgi:hypothetical protein